MPIENDIIDGRPICRFIGALTIWEAADTWQQILPIFSYKGPFDFDLMQVDECDVAGLQILCQIRNIAKKKDEIKIVNLSESVLTTIQKAGLTPNFFTQSMEGK